MYAAPRPALTADQTAALAGYTRGVPWGTNDTELQNYRGLLTSFQNISAAMDCDGLHDDVVDEIWSAIDYAITNAGVEPVATPTNYPADPNSLVGADFQIDLTRTEAINSYASKVAHALYHEVEGTFPWSITTYTEAQMRGLLDTAELYDVWDSEAATPATVSLVLDHSASHAYAITSAQYTPASNKYQAVENIIYNLGKTFRHSGAAGVDPQHIVTMDDALDYDSEWGGSSGHRVARSGCPFDSVIHAHWARSINIPALALEGWYVGGDHWSAAFPTTHGGDGLVLGHGDHSLVTALPQYDTADICESYNDYATNILILTPNPPYNPTAHYETERRYFLKERNRVSSTRKSQFATVDGWGWWYFDYEEEPFFTQTEMRQHYNELVALTGSDGIPTKPSAANTGTSGDVSTPYAGANPITTTTTVQDVTITGPLTCDATVTFINCLIDGGDSNVGIIVSDEELVQVLNCEFINCNPTAITGMPYRVYKCYIHEGHQHGLSISGTGYDNTSVPPAVPRIEKCFFEKLGRTTAGYGVYTTSTTDLDIKYQYNTFYLPTTGQTGNSSPYKCTAVVRAEGIHGGVFFNQNWADGGVNIISDASVSPIRVYSNRFGRSHETSDPATSLCSYVTLTAWDYNTYEDNGSVAGKDD